MGNSQEEDLIPGSTPGPRSQCGISVVTPNTSITVWTRVHSIDDTAVHSVPRPDASLALSPEEVAVVGRSDGRPPEYLDPAYTPTQIVPHTGESVVPTGSGDDVYVSRAHFMLRGSPGGGIVYTNGVPQRGGGIRPPVNSTWLVSPDVRLLGPAEEVLIERGTAVAIRLPNRCTIRLAVS